MDELESQNDSGKRDFVSSFFSKVEIALLLAGSPLGSWEIIFSSLTLDFLELNAKISGWISKTSQHWNCLD